MGRLRPSDQRSIMQSKRVICSCGLSGELRWDPSGNFTLDLGDFFYGSATASSVKEHAGHGRHVRIFLRDVPCMIRTVLSSDGPLRCQWLSKAMWGNYLYFQCKDMPSDVEVFTGGHLRMVGDWIKIHFHNEPTVSQTKLYLALMMAHHPRLGAASVLQTVPSDLLMQAMQALL